MTKFHPTEADVKKGVKKILDKHDWYWWSTPTGTMFGATGVSDICAVRRELFMAIETKHGKNVPTDRQRAFLNSIRAAGCLAFVVNEDLLPVLDAFLTAQDAADRRVMEHMRRIEVGEVAAGTPAEISASDHELMLNCIRSMQWWL